MDILTLKQVFQALADGKKLGDVDEDVGTYVFLNWDDLLDECGNKLDFGVLSGQFVEYTEPVVDSYGHELLKGDIVAVRDEADDDWGFRVFITRAEDPTYPYQTDRIVNWKLCKFVASGTVMGDV